MPDGVTSYKLRTVLTGEPALNESEARAIAVAETHLVGNDVRGAFIEITGARDDEKLIGARGWVFLSTDVRGFVSGPIGFTHPPVTSALSWVFVDLAGEVRLAVQEVTLAGTAPSGSPADPPS